MVDLFGLRHLASQLGKIVVSSAELAVGKQTRQKLGRVARLGGHRVHLEPERVPLAQGSIDCIR